MYRITYKNLRSGKYKTEETRDEVEYQKMLVAAVLLESVGAIIIKDTGEIKEIIIEEEYQC